MLKNDRGYTEDNPCGFMCGVSDLASWGRVHVATRETLGNLLDSGADFGELRGEAAAWYNSSEKYDTMATPGLGFELLSEFGVASNSELIGLSISSTKEGRRLIGELRQKAGIEGGEDVGGVDDSPSETSKDIRLFVTGGVLTALALGGWYLYKRGW